MTASIRDGASLPEIMMAYAVDAVENARRHHGMELDFSIESVQHVEEILDDISKTVPRSFVARILRKGPSERVLHHIAMELGAYVGECLRRHLGGEWVMATDVSTNPEEPTLQLVSSTGTLTQAFVVSKAFKRLANGPEDNVWLFCQQVIHHASV